MKLYINLCNCFISEDATYNFKMKLLSFVDRIIRFFKKGSNDTDNDND